MSWWTATAEVARHPGLWRAAARTAGRLSSTGWWRSPPFLPRPSRRYLGFRLVTQYGDARARPIPADVLRYLRWCRQWDRLIR